MRDADESLSAQASRRLDRRISALLLVLIAIVLFRSLTKQDDEEEYASVCLVNLANNPRTASLFSRGQLEVHGSKNTFRVVQPTEACHSKSLRLQLVASTQLMEWCLGDEICIVTGDEECKAPGAGEAQLRTFLTYAAHLHPVVPAVAAVGYLRRSLADEEASDFADGRALAQSWSGPPEEMGEAEHRRWQAHVDAGIQRLRPNVILREYYSSKYDYPGIPLGARYEFEPVSAKQRDAGNRPLLFNFLGSIKPGVELDRDHLREVINNHTWPAPTAVKFFDELVRTPNTSAVTDYREALLTSSFTLTPVGTADDCFRFWEAIEAGSIPIYVRRMRNLQKRTKCPDAFEDVLATNPPIVVLQDWSQLPGYVATVTEAEIADMRKRLVGWSKDFYAKTARNIDRAIDAAIVARANADATTSDDTITQRTDDVTLALKVLFDEEKQRKAASERQKDNLIQRVEEARLEQRKREKQAKRDKQAQELAAAGNGKAHTPHVKKINKKVVALAEELGFDAKQGASASTTRDLLSAIITSPALTDSALKRPSFSFIHETIVNILAESGYLSGFFSADELARDAAYMQWWLNKASFLDKVIRAVARDLSLPSDFVEATSMLNGQTPELTRMFLCFLAHVAVK